MARKTIYYTAGLIALYLIVEHYTGFTQDIVGAANGGSNVIRTLQGR